MAGDYALLFDRIQRAYTPSELTVSEMEDYLGTPSPGKTSLAQQIARTRQVFIDVQEANTIPDLEGLAPEAASLEVHNATVSREIQTKIGDIEREIRRAERQEVVLSRNIAESLSERQRIADLERDEKRELLAERTAEERKETIKSLRRFAPRSLGGFTKAERQRGIKALARLDAMF